MDPHARAFALMREKNRLARPIPDDLVISDSEPEREQQRHQVTSNKVTHSRQVTHKKTRKPRVEGPIIEISDDSSSQRDCMSVIMLSDDSDDAIPRLKSDNAQIISRTNRAPVVEEKVEKAQVIASTEDSSNSDFSIFNPSRFAFVPKSRPATLVQSELPVKRAPSLVPSNSSRKPSRRSHTATESFTDDQIRRLSRCVACNLAWTAKKTVPMKVSHIRTCQKKNALSDETIRLRLSQELSNTASASTKKGGTEVASSVPTTLMEDVIKDTGPKKRGKRKEAVSTITNIQQRHDAIQARAKSLFGFTSSEDSDDAGDLSHPQMDESRPSRSKTPPLTQNFPVSRFGSKNGFESDPKEDPPSDEQTGMQPLCPYTTLLSLLNQRLHLHSKGNEKARLHPMHVQSSPVASNRNNPWAEDARKHQEVGWSWGPHPWNHQVQCPVKQSGSPSLQASPVSRRPKGLTSPTISRGFAFSPVSQFPISSSPVQSPTKGKRQATPSKRSPHNAMEDLDQEQFDTLMQQAVQNDIPLLLRIIRYEPISIDEFVALATGDTLPSRRLLSKLRSFLDSKAIHFYIPGGRKR
ncbi:hypothetical protein CPB86DRAFT_368322 [Serendipita vermifera]|nr:hypothetical protein CPB86DRAFT_368322 [Serendipita vermifera]